jgi:hypothetical protein
MFTRQEHVESWATEETMVILMDLSCTTTKKRKLFFGFVLNGISVSATSANATSFSDEAILLGMIFVKLTNWKFKLSNAQVAILSSNYYITSHDPSLTPINTVNKVN